MSGVYQITCQPTGERYIGGTVDFLRRWDEHQIKLRSGTHVNYLLQAAWGKYGEGAFSFYELEPCAKSDLLEVEQHHIDAASPEFNLATIAGAPMRGRTHSPEARAKMSTRAREPARLANLAAARKHIQPHSVATKAKISASHLGQKLSPEHRASLLRRGPHSQEHRRKLSEAATRRWAREKAAR